MQPLTRQLLIKKPGYKSLGSLHRKQDATRMLLVDAKRRLCKEELHMSIPSKILTISYHICQMSPAVKTQENSLESMAESS